MFQVWQVHLPHPSRKQVLFASLASGIGVFGLLVAVALTIVEALIHPKRKTAFDRYTLSPFEFDLPAEAVVFPSLHGDYEVSGWYIPHPHAPTTILVCPGYRSRAADVLGICSHLWKAGQSILVFEYYGHGAIPLGPRSRSATVR